MRNKQVVMIDARIAKRGSEHGIARHVKELLFNLFKIASGNNKTYFILVNNDNVFLDEVLPSNFKLIILKNSVFSLKSQIELFFVIKKYKPDIFHSPQFIVPLLSTVPLIATIHDMNHLALGNNYSFIKRFYYQFFLQKKLKKAKAIITVSNFSKQEIIKYFKIKPELIHVIYNGVQNNFKPLNFFSQEKIISVLKKYDLPEKYIFTLGNSKPHKNLAKVLESYCLGNFNLPLVILTNIKEQIEDLKQNYNCNKQIKTLTYVAEEDFPIIYGLSKIFIYVSLYEGFGLPPIEAAACGVPSIVSNTTSLPEIMGNNAIYVDPLKLNEIQAGMEFGLQTESTEVQAIVKNGFTWIQKYSWLEMAKETLHIYDNLQ
ncbi:glycosyltransferase family 4 protein [Pigmentibacter ruber]|uniref:glycosyltransferase family 4 protein n=1 Tax=Pigmentibacter ruber TaxID=2683196 RepID=UPI00131CD347|nr:glycosyltransferase family 1 protein [Pigmentibacter ruber]